MDDQDDGFGSCLIRFFPLVAEMVGKGFSSLVAARQICQVLKVGDLQGEAAAGGGR